MEISNIDIANQFLNFFELQISKYFKCFNYVFKIAFNMFSNQFAIFKIFQFSKCFKQVSKPFSNLFFFQNVSSCFKNVSTCFHFSILNFSMMHSYIVFFQFWTYRFWLIIDFGNSDIEGNSNIEVRT